MYMPPPPPGVNETHAVVITLDEFIILWGPYAFMLKRRFQLVNLVFKGTVCGGLVYPSLVRPSVIILLCQAVSIICQAISIVCDARSSIFRRNSHETRTLATLSELSFMRRPRDFESFSQRLWEPWKIPSRERSTVLRNCSIDPRRMVQQTILRLVRILTLDMLDPWMLWYWS